METRVLDALEKNIADSQGTVMYLTLCKHITSSYMQNDLNPLERLYNLWYSVYFLRCWRKWIQTHDGCTMAENFITTNAYTFVELNAQSMIELMIKLRTENSQSMFLPLLFSSQPCEEFFRQMRSMGTANFTKINFTFYEILHMISRVEIMYKIIFSRNEIVSPRFKSKLKTTDKAVTVLPSDEQILETMINARNAALKKASEFGINLTWEDVITCDLQHSGQTLTEIRDEISTDNLGEDDDVLSATDSEASSGEIENIDENTTNIESQAIKSATSLHANSIDVVDLDGLSRNMRISTLIWSLSTSKHKLSSDRLKRVQQDETVSVASKRFKSSEPTNDELYLFKSENI